MAFQLSLALASAYMNFSQTWFPTNIIARWMRQPGHLRYAWPLSIALYFAYAGIAMWLDALPAAETNGWLRLAIVIASIDALKFACGVILWPLMGAWRGLRRLVRVIQRRGDAWLVGRTSEL